MWKKHDQLLTNALLYMTEAVSDLKISDETDPEDPQHLFLRNKAIILAATSIEHYLKSEILDIDWKDIFSNIQKADMKKLKSGNLHSKSLHSCIEYLEDKKRLKKGDGMSLKKLANQRNKIVHIAHNTQSASARSLIAKSSVVLIRRIEEDDELRELFKSEIDDLKAWTE